MKNNHFLLVLVATFLVNCSNDVLPAPETGDCDALQPTYEKDIKAIIDRSCAYSSCHLDSAPGVFTSYEGLLNDLNDGDFSRRVISLRADESLGMPPNNAPDGRPKDLTEDEINIITCWLEAGFPEN